MTEAVDGETGKTYRYTYDEMGNILTARTYTVSASGSETMVAEKTYRYENGIFSGYTAKGSMPITYETDAMGNPIQIGNGFANTTLTWGEGRMLTGIRRNAKNLYVIQPFVVLPLQFGIVYFRAKRGYMLELSTLGGEYHMVLPYMPVSHAKTCVLISRKCAT